MGANSRFFLQATVWIPVFLGAQAAPLHAQESGPATVGSPIVVYGTNQQNRWLAGLNAESELDENGIASYGVDTIGDLLDAVLTQVGSSGDGPVVLVNGQPATGLAEISDLPPEAVSRIQVLPRSAAMRLGQAPSRRVVNVVIKPNLRQVTVSANGRLATAGQGLAGDAEVNLLLLKDSNRRSLVIKGNAASALYEADRGIVDSAGTTPYAFAGNLVAYPSPGLEIDPALSTAAGRVVTIAGVPTSAASPSLAAFAALAGVPNISDLGRYRTLLPRQKGISGNANLTQKIGQTTTLSLNLQAEASRADGLTGAAPAELRVPAGSPWSPFSRDVLVDRYVGPALAQRSDASNITAAAIVNGQLGRWRYAVNGNFTHRTTDTLSDRSYDIAALQAAILAGTANPFATLPAGLLGALRQDRSHSRSDYGNFFATLSGSPFILPAGPAFASLRLEWRANRNRSDTQTGTATLTSLLHRDEEIAQIALQLPLIAGGKGGSPIGSLGLELGGALRHVTAVGGLHDYVFGLNWQPVSPLTIHASINHEEIAPPANALTDPVVILDGVRTYDFVRQETVLVRYTYGGNPAIGVEKRRTSLVSALLNPIPGKDLTLSAEYMAVRGDGAYAALPPVNAEVQSAFPDRFLRDSTGRLIAVDGRPVQFSKVSRKQLRLGITFSQTLGAGASTAGGSSLAGPAKALQSGWRINGYLNDLWMLASTRQARASLAEVDLLSGGAIGYGGGLPRHTVQFGGGVVHNGVGLQVNGTWRSRSRIASGTLAAPDEIVFAPQAQVDMRIFANLGPLMPGSALAKGMRLSLSVDNLFDSKQRVTDKTGAVPLRYQPYLLDPLGRTISLGLRKVF